MAEKIATRSLQLTSSAFPHEGWIPVKYTCDGEDISPPLSISGIPHAARSLVLVVDDPDAPGGLFTHWTVWNLDPMLTEISENSLPPKALQGLNSFGTVGYGGPCPPSGIHRYQFHLYALDSHLPLLEGAEVAQIRGILEELADEVLAKTMLMGKYTRKNRNP